mgnify:CR=1 FL=1
MMRHGCPWQCNACVECVELSGINLNWGGRGGPGMSHAGCGDHSSSGTAGPGGKHSGAQQTKQRRRWAAPSPVSAAEQLQGGSRHEQQQGL